VDEASAWSAGTITLTPSSSSGSTERPVRVNGLRGGVLQVFAKPPHFKGFYSPACPVLHRIAFAVVSTGRPVNLEIPALVEEAQRGQ